MKKKKVLTFEITTCVEIWKVYISSKIVENRSKCGQICLKTAINRRYLPYFDDYWPNFQLFKLNSMIFGLYLTTNSHTLPYLNLRINLEMHKYLHQKIDLCLLLMQISQLFMQMYMKFRISCIISAWILQQFLIKILSSSNLADISIDIHSEIFVVYQNNQQQIFLNE